MVARNRTHEILKSRNLLTFYIRLYVERRNSVFRLRYLFVARLRLFDFAAGGNCITHPLLLHLRL